MGARDPQTISSEVPLLTLPAVLYPGTFLPLQITEERHRSLLRDCLDGARHLGVVLTPPGNGTTRATLPCTTGCLASIALLLYEDDQEMPLNAVLYGERRIRVMEYTQQEPYLTGRVQPLDDYTGNNAERRCKEAAQLFQLYLELIQERHQLSALNLPLPQDPTMASYLLASVLTLPLPTKQRWLESASTALRLEEQLAYLHDECETLSTLIALAQNSHHHYQLPDPSLYMTLISPN